VLDGERSSSLIKGAHLGIVKPGSRASKTLYLCTTGNNGSRTLDISIQSSSPIPLSPSDTTETLRTLVVPVVPAIEMTHDVGYRRSLGEQPGLADLRTYESDYWDDLDGGEAVVTSTMKCGGPWGVRVEGVRLLRQVSSAPGIVWGWFIDCLCRTASTQRSLITMIRPSMRRCLQVVSLSLPFSFEPRLEETLTQSTCRVTSSQTSVGSRWPRKMGLISTKTLYSAQVHTKSSGDD
jgi:hypothetical protein